MMRRPSLTARRVILVIASALIASLAVVASAPALVVNDNGTDAGAALVPSARGSALPSGVSAVSSSNACTDPWLSSDLGGPSVGSNSLCYRGGSVIHKNETFALTWDAPFDGSQHHYWEKTRGYVEQFLRDVADSSGSLASPFAVTSQYNDGGGRALNASVFGGGCIDYGVAGGSACEYGNPSGAGHDLPANGCTPAGDSFVAPSVVTKNQVCLTDAQLQSEVSTMVTQTGILGRTQPGYTPLVTLLLPAGIETCLDGSHALCSANAWLTPPPPGITTAAGVANATISAGVYRVELTYSTNHGESAPSASEAVATTGSTSTITIASPPEPAVGSGVIVTGWNAYVTGPNGASYTLQGSGAINTPITLNSLTTNGATPPIDPAYCSYHSQVNVGGTDVSYVVQPWTPGTTCDEPDTPVIPPNPPVDVLETDFGTRLVSPLSQGMIAAVTDPALNGWVAQDGSETSDNGTFPQDWGGAQYRCQPLSNGLDTVTLGSSSQNPYYLQREFNNAGAIESEPFTYDGCAPVVTLGPQFVAPSAVDQGDVVQLDGSATESTLIVPNSGYAWNFGDGTSATGPSVVHAFTKAGTYNVTLTTTDRGGYSAALTETIQVLGPTGQPAVAPPAAAGPGGGSGGSSGPSLSVRLQLMPQSLKAVLRRGIAVQVTSNKAANGVATVSITRAAARRAHIKPGKNASVRIGLGTVSSITNGTITLRLHLSPSVAKKLAHLGHVTMTVRLALVAPGNQQLAIDAAGKY